MSETRQLLERIAALRRRVEQAQSVVREAGHAAAAVAVPEGDDVPATLEEQVAEGEYELSLIDGTIRRLAGTLEEASNTLPGRLTARVRALLERARQIVAHLRQLADEPLLSDEAPADDPLAASFRETAAMTESALRLVQALPDAPSAQLRLSDGLDGILSLITDRARALTDALTLRRQDADRVDALAKLLIDLEAGRQTDLTPFLTLAEAVWADALQGAPFRVPAAEPDAGTAGLPAPARFVAAHSLVTAQVLAVMARHDPDLRRDPHGAVLLGLIHDVGMLRVPADVLAQPATLTDAQRRELERHPHAGADVIARQLPEAANLAAAVAAHHERLDGTGYPSALSGAQVNGLARFLAVADTYAALVARRPHRSAFDPRTALTETVMAAERGRLDRYAAGRLLHLSFYPVGSVVELADGPVGVVVGTPHDRRDPTAPARPVLALLTDADRHLLPAPQHLDLMACEGRTIVRALTAAERRGLLGRRYPQLAA